MTVPKTEKTRIAPRQLTGFTIVELLVVISIIALLVGILLPAIGKAREAAQTTQSSANMRNMSAAHAAYSADWSDRQWTAVPDDAALYKVNGAAGDVCTSYINNGGCPPQMILGWDADAIPTIWGYFTGCGGFPGNCGNWPVYMPNSFTPAQVYGSFRLPNVESFNSYLNGRFYDPVFYAPKDSIILAGAEKYFALPDEFTIIPPDGTAGLPQLWNSSYCNSPAAMWAPDVLGKNSSTGLYYTNPDTLAAGYKSPAAGQATYPDLKTRMIEHHWLQQKPNSDVNYNFTGGYTPWYFNHGFNSAPVTMFFDGHVQVFGCGDAMDAHGRAAATSSDGSGLWSLNTPLGGNVANGTGGYFMTQSYDFVVATSHTILTLDGIQGRDAIGMK